MVKVRSKRITKQKIRETTEGVFESLIDYVIWFAGFSTSAMLPQSPYGVGSRASRVGEELLATVNYRSIKLAINEARRKGLIKKVSKKRKSSPAITKAGWERLNRKLPQYQKKRIWENKVFLLTYDIPEERRRDRDVLRDYAKRLGMGMLQKSVWFALHDPCDILEKFIEERNLRGTIIISSLGKDSSIGDEGLEELIVRIFKLKEINERYIEWIDKTKENSAKRVDLLLQFISILKIDPQIPFELLPNWWVGDEAYKIYKTIA